MELCAGLIFVALILFVVAIVGHGLWLLTAMIVQALFGGLEPSERDERGRDERGRDERGRRHTAARPRRRCVGCGTTFGRGLDACPSCGLDPAGATAQELRDLETTVSQIQALVDAGTIEAALGEQIYHGIEARQERLPGGQTDAAPAPAATNSRGRGTTRADLERLLSACPDVRQLSFVQRKQAWAWYRGLTEAELTQLSAACLLPLGRLVRLAGLATRSARLFEMLLTLHPQSPEAPLAALEAGRLALLEKKTDKARRFLRQALDGPLPEADRAVAETLYRAMQPDEALEPILVSLAPDIAPSGEAASTGEMVAPSGADAGAKEGGIGSVPEPEPSRSWTQMLGGFMEERNILWGELVGGLLIVGCSIALVISLWRTLEQIPYFPFLIFAAITAALFAAGLYTLSHWKLEATSRGLLVIATLLTPLDFLVLAGLSRGREAGVLDWGAEFLAVAGFAVLVLRSARILMNGLARGDWLLTLAVVGVSSTQLLVPRWLDAAEPANVLFVLLSLTPVLFHALALGWVLVRERDRLDAAKANQLFLLLGMSTFAAAVALGFIVYWSDEPVTALRHLSVPIAVAACPLLAAGALVENRLRALALPEAVQTHGLSPAMARLVGTIIGLAAGLVMLGALVLGWPRPVALVVVGGLNAAAFAGVALGLRLGYMHAPAMACLAVAFLTAFHGLRGELVGPDSEQRLLTLAVSAPSGSALAMLAVLLAAASEWLIRADRRLDGKYHVVGAGTFAALALVLVAQAGMLVPARAFLVFGVCGLGGLLVNVRWRLWLLTIVGALTLLGAIAFAIHGWSPELPSERLWLLALPMQASICFLASLGLERALKRFPGKFHADAEALQAAFVVPLRDTGLTLSLLAVFPLMATSTWSGLTWCVLASLWLAALWLTLAWRLQAPGWFAACQLAVTLALLYQVTAWLHGQEWVGPHAERLLHPWSLQTYMLGLTGLGVGWLLVRRVLKDNERARTLLEPGWPAVDWLVLVGVVGGQFLLALFAVIPAALREILPAQGHELVNHAFRNAPVLDLSLSWTILVTLALALLAALWERWASIAILGAVLLALSAVVTAALGLDGQLAAASGLRWGLAGLFLAGSAMLWVRHRFQPHCERLGITWGMGFDAPRWSRVLLLAGNVAPVVLLTALTAIVGFCGHRPAGPAAESLFANMGYVSSMAVPLLVVTLAMVGHGVREQAAGYIFAAGIFLLTTVMGGRALSVVLSAGFLAEDEGVYLVQLGIVTVSLWGLAWLSSGRWGNGALLAVQASLALLGNVALLLPALAIVLWSARASELIEQAAAFPGWLGLAGTFALSLWVARLWAPRLAVHLLGCAGLGIGVLAAALARDPGGWRGYHVLTLTWTLLALVMLTAAWVGSQCKEMGPVFWSGQRRAEAAGLVRQLFPARPARRWVETLCVSVVLLALGGTWGDPERPYWSSSVTLAVSVLLGAMAVWVRRPGYVYASALLINVVAYVVWQAWLVDHWGILVWFALGPVVFDRFLLLQILALASASSAWSLLERRLRRLEPPVDLRGNVIPFAHAAVLVAFSLLAILVLTGVVSDFVGLDVHLDGVFIWIVIATTGLALTLCFWDPEAQEWGLPTAPLYGLGLLSVALVLHQDRLPPRDLAWWGTLLLGAYAAGVSLLVRLAPRWSGLLWRLRIPPRTEGWLAGWYLPAQIMVAILVLAASLWMCLDFETASQRLAGPLAALAIAAAAWLATACWGRLVEPAGGVMAHADGPAHVTLSLGVLTALETSWAVLDPEIAAPWLHRSVLVMAVLLLAAGGYGIALPRLLPADNLWHRCGRRLSRGLAMLVVPALALVLVQEFLLYNPDPDVRRTPMAAHAVILVGVTLAALVVLQLKLAVARFDHVPGRSPLSEASGVAGAAHTAGINPAARFYPLSERGRVWLVWGAEIAFILFLVHLRLNVPDFFPNVGHYWPLVLMGVGFAGVGLAEMFRRRSLRMLAEPLERTGLFLPLLPLAAFLVRPLADLTPLRTAIPGLDPLFRYLDRLPQHFAMHALLWFLLGMLYALAAVLKRASWLGLVAALAANMGLWVILAHHEDVAFLLHPQLWLIPLGLILLAAEYLHRDRLTPQQSQGVRYLGLLLIYVSSTADMFITGLGNSVLLPILLALLSIAGVLAGILLRVRAFLFLGVAFLFLVVFAQIWHAAVDRHQTWIWWASGIVLGAAILTLFALFEKRRNDVLKVVEEIKRWR